VNVLLVMIPLSLVLLGGAIYAFFWAVDHGQFDDLKTPSLLPLTDLPTPRALSGKTDSAGESGEGGDG